MSLDDWQVLVRDQNGARIGELEDYRLEFTLRHNDVGAWTVSCGAGSVLDGVGHGGGVVVVRGGATVFSGSLRVPSYRRSRGVETLTYSGDDDLALLAEELAYPEAPALTTATDAYDVRTGNLSTVLLGYVGDNIGPSAASGRQSVLVGTDYLLGAAVTGRARLDSLLELCQQLLLAEGSDDVGVRVMDRGGAFPTFEVYPCADRSTSVQLTDDQGLDEVSWEPARPGATTVVVGGGGEGTARTFVTVEDASAVGALGRRVRRFRDARDTTDVGVMGQRGQALLTEQAAPQAIAAVVRDGDPWSFAVHWGVGDTVSVEVQPGALTTAVVREVTVTIDSAGVQVSPVLGSWGASALPDFFSTLRRHTRRTGALERR